MYNSNYVLNLHRFYVIGILISQNGHLTLKSVLKVKLKVTKMKPICDFLLMNNSNYVLNLYRFHVMATFRSQNGHLTLTSVLKVKFKVT